MERKIVRSLICLAYLAAVFLASLSLGLLSTPRSWPIIAMVGIIWIWVVVICTITMCVMGIHKYKWMVKPLIDPKDFFELP